MVSVSYAVLAVLLGVLCYLLIPFVGAAASVRARSAIANYYWSNATRLWGKMCLVQRLVGGMVWKQMEYNDELSGGQVVLDDRIRGDNEEVPFNDPDDRLKRLNKKPLALVHEDVPAVVDIQLAEIGAEWFEHRADGNQMQDGRANPYITLDADTSLADLSYIFELVTHGTKPEHVGRMEDFTRKRFEKYRSRVGAGEVLSTLTGFAVGLGGMMAIAWVRTNMLDSGGAPEPTTPVPVQIADVATTAVTNADIWVNLL